MRSSQGRVVFILMAALFVCLTLGAAETPQASGKFKSKDISFDVTGAYAYWSRTSDEGPTIELAVSNDRFIPSALDAFYDPRPVIDNIFVDEQTAVVYFKFEPNGKYRGMSYYLGSGNGCGFCSDSKTNSTVRITGQRLQGKLTFSGDNPTFDIQVDVPVAPKEWGKPIAGEGGEVGTAFRAYNAAMDKADKKAIVALLDQRNRQNWAKREKEGTLDDYLDYRMEKQHWRIKDAHIVGGYVRENEAVLLVKASSPLIEHVHGQVILTKESGSWKISDEIYETGE